MVKTLHRAGIEVILDVVYNHTGEGNHLGPTLCFRGIDNRAYYKLDRDRPSSYLDYTGCGNSLEVSNQRTLQLILDSLRYWVQDMHVDGFRFDLAVTLARDPYDFEQSARFFATVQQDPVLSQVKLIAEPWDVGPNGYRVGGFLPVGRSGTRATATVCGASGAETTVRYPSSLHACRARATFSKAVTADRSRASIS